jgi:hypothetical protein
VGRPVLYSRGDRVPHESGTFCSTGEGGEKMCKSLEFRKVNIIL